MGKLILTFAFLIFTSNSFSQKDAKLSVQTWTFHKYTLLETIHKADTLGIPFLEVYPGQKVGGDIPGVFSYTLSTENRERVKELLRVKGIKVIALGVIDKYYYNKDNLEEFFAFAKYMEIPFITAEPEWADLDRFNELAGKYGIRVGIHCHPKPSSHYWHPDSTLKAMQGREHVGAWPDIGHWARNGVEVLGGLKKLRSKLWGMHFKDVREFDNTAAMDTLFGLGVCRAGEVLKTLKEINFKGVLSLEYEANEEDNMGDMRRNVRFALKKSR